MLSFRSFPRWIKLLAISLSVNLLILPLIIQAAENDALPQETEQNYNEICQIAEQDAKSDESDAIAYGCGGFLCGVFGFLVAYASKPTPPASRLVGKDANYVQAYTSCYEKKAKSIRTKAACTGWLIGSVVSLAYMASTGGFSAEE